MRDKFIDPLRALAEAVAEAGGQVQLADRIGFHQSYISEVLNGKRPPSTRLLAAIGLVRVVAYAERAAPD
jgi:hypothetical protein